QGGARLLLRPVSIAGADAGQWPVRIRVNMRSTPDFEAGATIRATMRLLPPPRPSEPGGYDFARDAWFQQIGAVGSISGIARRAEAAQAPGIAPWIARFNATVDRARNRLTSRIIEVIGGPQGAVAAALVTGKRGTIPEETNEALRAAGIYHVVSISGLHMVLAAGVFLWSLRALLALFPAFALTRPIKTIAAVFAMAGSIAYCIFAGAEVATERALIMTLIMLGAVVFARPALSMRNLALAALLVMSLEPHTILGPSFQMSFAAVAAMIALFEQRPGRTESGRLMPLGGESGMQHDPHADRRATWSGRVLAMMLALSATTLIASIATGPYGAYHFHRFAPFGLLGNLLALPVVEFVVMPAAVFGTLATAFGLDAPVWTVMGYGVELMLRAAHWVASLQGAQVHLKAFGASALLAMSFALLWASLWLTPLRWFAIAPAIAGVSLAMHTPRPDIMIDRQGRTLAFRTAEGTLSVMNARANRFGVSQWLASDADNRKSDDATLQRGASCDRMGCTAILPGGRVLALTLDRRALSDDCSRADILVTPFFVRDICKGPEKLIDGTYLQTSGALGIFIAQDGALHPRHTRVPGYDRPWSPAPRQNASATAPPQALNAQPHDLPDEGWTRAQ
ncbi:MAG: ComEC family competence protein, partial [Alphaproteobacteria bacterium]|nr:ComEC family competence protein [Alphaproteobacteria bacterium]